MAIKPVLTIPKRVIFSDVNCDVLDDGPYELVYNEDAINKSLQTIFATPKFSRPFRRLFGNRILALLFDPIDNITAGLIGMELREAASEWEPRIDNISVSVLPDYDNQQYYVDMTYRIPRLADKMVSYTFNLSKT